MAEEGRQEIDFHGNPASVKYTLLIPDKVEIGIVSKISQMSLFAKPRLDQIFGPCNEESNTNIQQPSPTQFGIAIGVDFRDRSRKGNGKAA